MKQNSKSILYGMNIDKTKARFFSETLVFMAIGVVIGIIVAVFEVIFAKGIEYLTALRIGHGGTLWLLTLPVFGLLIVYIFNRFGGKAKQGMALAFKIEQGQESSIPKRTMVLMTLATWLSHLGGASVGKEGVGMQIGATISNMLTRKLPMLKDRKTIFVLTGMAAGFAGLFGTPFTAIFFAMEIFISGVIEFRALAPCVMASLSAARMSSLLGLHAETFVLTMNPEFNLLSHGWKLVLLGIIFGCVGALFARTMHFAHHFFEKLFPNSYVRILCGSVVAGLLLWLLWNGRYCGSGASLIEATFEGETIYAWDFAVKFLLTAFCLSIGFVGGEVMPLFTIGTTLGAIVAPWFGLPATFGAALGYAAVFGAGTNTWLASIMVGAEVFGFAYFPFFFVCSTMAYLFNGNDSIYALQRTLSVAYLTEDAPHSVDAANQAIRK